MRDIISPFTAVWVLDFEFVAHDGEHPEVVCLVAHEIISGRWVHTWQDEFSAPPFPMDEKTLFVGYSAAAEWSCFLALNWPMPLRCIDLYAEFVRSTNGAYNSKLFPSLLAAASHFGIDTMAADHKGAMRDLILSGGPWSESQRREILYYCAEDVRITIELLHAMQTCIVESKLTLGGALLRGRYTQAVARMEWNGTPIDVHTYDRLRNGWEDIKRDLIMDIDRQYGVFDRTTFVAARFAAWVEREGIPWPRLPSGQLALDDDTFRERAKRFPKVAPLRELRHALGKLRLNSLAIGRDGRNRTSLMPFGSKTGRNQPSNSRFIFGTSRWMRSLIKPEPARSIAYVDWTSQEIAVAGALSGDEALWQAYSSGDAYISFAKQAGLGTTPNPRSLLNWPMQSAGAEMLRLASCLLTEQGIRVCCPVHDALLVEGATDEMDCVIAATRAAMEQASELVLGEGRIVMTDVELITYPNRYVDEAGAEMWGRVMALLKARGW